MADQTINPVLPVVKTRNSLQNKKAAGKKLHPAEKNTDEKPKKKKGGIDTYA